MRMMITIQFDPQHFEAMSALIPKEQEHIKALMSKGIVEAIYISSDPCFLRQGSNELDSSSSTERSSSVMLRCAQHLAAARDRPFLRGGVTRGDCSNGQGLFVQIEPCLNRERWCD